jgi:Uroporphyrinogen decarboxylase (URO-D).
MLSDHLRSFSECSKDIRRRPEKVMAACEAILPMAVKASILPNSNRYNRTFNPLHMGPYMREKDFQRFYWPTFKAYVEALDEAGVGVNIFMEQDWTRYLDYLNELPKGCLMFFEYGDPKVIKEKVGKRHIISGLYPMSILKTETEQVCIDKAKEIMDILAPGGNYMFGFDKGILRLKDVNVNNLKAVLNFAQEYGKY